MDKRSLIEALMEGPRQSRDLSLSLVQELLEGSEPLLAQVDDERVALTPAGYEYAEREYGLVLEPDAELQHTLESLGKAGDAVERGGDWLKFFPYLARCTAIGFALSAGLYAVMVLTRQWPL